MIDLHTHTFFSDGVLAPSELIRRAVVAGYRVLAIADHADMSNLDLVIPRIAAACEENTRTRSITAICGIELTHLPVELFAKYTGEARRLGAKIVVAHGESPVEPVEEGTNRAAIEAGVDILAHPGEITAEECTLAAERGVYLEVTSRRGHNKTNGHVVEMARRTGARLVLNTDAHAPGDLITLEEAQKVAFEAGMTEDEFIEARVNMYRLAGVGPEDRH